MSMVKAVTRKVKTKENGDVDVGRGESGPSTPLPALNPPMWMYTFHKGYWSHTSDFHKLTPQTKHCQIKAKWYFKIKDPDDFNSVWFIFWHCFCLLVVRETELEDHCESEYDLKYCGTRCRGDCTGSPHPACPNGHLCCTCPMWSK